MPKRERPEPEELKAGMYTLERWGSIYLVCIVRQHPDGLSYNAVYDSDTNPGSHFKIGEDGGQPYGVTYKGILTVEEIVLGKLLGWEHVCK